MSVTESSAPEWKSPVRKLVGFFERSRNKWKKKYQHLKRERKGMENQIRAVEKSRENWADRAKQAEEQVCELERQLEIFKKDLL
jgi:septal ring factor EnvC (AmiA/AmiB activator)